MHHLFYFPDRVKHDDPERAGLAFESVYFDSADGTCLSGWFIPAADSAARKVCGTVIHMHGNAQNMSAHWRYAEWLPRRGFNLFVFDYRGYGNSQGKPDPQGIFEDAMAAIDYARDRNDIHPERLCVFGQSLGGMLAIAAAAANPKGIRAVLAEAPIHSYTALADDMLPALQLATDDSCCASAYVAQLAPIPLLLLHGTADKVVPYAHSLELLAAAQEPKRLVTIEGGEHNDAMTSRHGEIYQDMLVEFFKQHTTN